jgi:alpha-1,4-glucan:alpha-1,4-glucan 6-glycosyltransferase/4-alpha-glucanotransferase
LKFREALGRLAALYRVQTTYVDIAGRTHVASDEALLAILTALGCPLRGTADVEGALAERRAALAARLLPPVSVSWGGTGPVVLYADARDLADEITVDVELEAGDALGWRAATRSTRALRHIDETGVERVRLELAPPAPVPLGYHQVHVRSGSRTASGRLWSAPERAFNDGGERSFGVLAPVYALRSERNAGIGDYTDLAHLTDWVASHGGHSVATLPLLPTFVEGPFDPSPYAPVSRRFWNELYVSLDHLDERPELELARALRDSDAYRQTTAELRATDRVDYAAVATHKRRVLSLAAEATFGGPGGRERLGRVLAEHPDWEDYARFRAVAERQGRPFGQWPDRLRAGRLESDDHDPASFRYHLYCQVEAEAQIGALARAAGERGVGLYMDLPLGAHPHGYDSWRHGAELLVGCTVGAPPDALFEGGQNWGFAPPHPERCSTAGHALFVACLRHQMRHAATLRIDHVMGLHRLFCIPNGETPSAGVYVDQPSEELHAALCIESWRSTTRLVGEDLGTVPPETRSAMARHGFGRLFVMQYEPIPEPGQKHVVPPDATASLNTHDMPTFLGYWRGRDIDTRVALGLATPEVAGRDAEGRVAERARLEHWLESLALLETPSSEEALLEAELRYLGESPAQTLLVSLSDLTGDETPQNVPGTGPERPNWKAKIRLPLEAFLASPEVEHLLSALRRPEAAPDEPPEGAAPIVRSRPVTRLTDMDLHLFNEGTHRAIDQALGSHVGHVDGEAGVHFAVWAPNARAVSVTGDFNDWRRQDAPLWPHGASGIWEGFIPGLVEGDLYKYVIVTADGTVLEKADPVARMAETPPRTASRVVAPRHEWRDAAWMASRSSANGIDAPCSVYEVHLGSWRRAPDGALLGYRELAGMLAAHVKDLGFTHVELLPVMEHPFYGSWGYQVTSYFATTGRYGRPDDLMAFVDVMHQEGIGVIFDWVPGHFPTDAHGIGQFDGTHLYEHADPRLGFHPDWKSYIFNYGRHEVRSFLISSALYWLERMHGDGLRVDGVASMLYLDYSRQHGEWIPNAYGGRENLDAIGFLRQLNEALYGALPDIQTIAEESTAWPMVSRPTYVGGLGFGLKWDMGWMHDTLAYFSRDPVHRKYHHELLTFRGVYAYHENFVLPLSHDEVVHGKGSLLAKMPGDDWQRFANLRTLYAYMYACPGHKLLFMGSEIAPWTEWDHEQALPFHLLGSRMHAGIAQTLRELNRLYRTEPALHELDRHPEGFLWVDVHNAAESVLVFERRARDGARVLCVFNLTPVPRFGYRIGVDRLGFWSEVLNTDAGDLGGSGLGNLGGVHAEDRSAHGRAASIVVTLPPLAALYFRSPS